MPIFNGLIDVQFSHRSKPHHSFLSFLIVVELADFLGIGTHKYFISHFPDGERTADKELFYSEFCILEVQLGSDILIRERFEDLVFHVPIDNRTLKESVKQELGLYGFL